MDDLETQLNRELDRVQMLAKNDDFTECEDFNIRGKLYKLAGEIAPNAREQDIFYIQKWLNPKAGEKSVDIAAGTGFLTYHLVKWTQSKTYAVDTSSEQLTCLKNRLNNRLVTTINGSISAPETIHQFGQDFGQIDFVTSFGGIHHIIDTLGPDNKIKNNQRAMMETVANLLKPGGRFVASDVCGGTSLSRHFEKSVKTHGLTGHKEKWLTIDRLQNELISGTDLEYIKAEIINSKMVFDSERHMALFMKGLHAYAISIEAVIADLQNILGFEKKDDKIYLNWPLLFFHLQKRI